MTVGYEFSKYFPSYKNFDPQVPIWCVTPEFDRTIHRFFDTSPFSPSGRYLGLTRLPYEDRPETPEIPAEVVIVDLYTGEHRMLAKTHGWDTQLGAQVQWGATDNQLFFNDLDLESCEPFGILLDPFSGEMEKFSGTVYVVSPDGKWIASPDMLRMGVTQPGYGFLLPRRQLYFGINGSEEDGIFLTEVESGETRLLVSIKQIIETAEPAMDPHEFKNGTFYGFHVKWNPQGNRLMLILRWLPSNADAKLRAQVITLNADGSAIKVAVPASEWDRGGHHPNWCPDGEHVMMNLRVHDSAEVRLYHSLPGRLRAHAARYLGLRDNGMRFIKIHYDGEYQKLMSESIVGSGHPSLHPNEQHLLTDAYLNEPMAFGDGTTPIRLIDLTSEQELTLARVRTSPPYRGLRNELRVDPHPTWDREYRRIVFNACIDGTRRVYLADLSSIFG